MYTTDPTEARIHDAGNILVAPPIPPLRDFFGSVITPEDLASSSPDLAQKTVYLCGDIARINARQLHAADRVFVIRDLSHNSSRFPSPTTASSRSPSTRTGYSATGSSSTSPSRRPRTPGWG